MGINDAFSLYHTDSLITNPQTMIFYRNIGQLVVHSYHSPNPNIFGCLVHIVIKRFVRQAGLLSSMAVVNSTDIRRIFIVYTFLPFVPAPLLYVLSYLFLLAALLSE
jgi:hypothetical protein